MKVAPVPTPALTRLLKEQDGAVTTAQALAAGMTPRQLRTLAANGWARPHRGVFISPDADDPFRASVRAALLSSPAAAVCRVTAARLHRIWGLAVWNALEQPRLIFPAGVTHNPRRGVHRHTGFLPGEATNLDGFRATTLERTIRDLALVLGFDDLVCAVDSALRLGWVPVEKTTRGRRRLARAVALSDARSESPLETKTRLLFVRADLVPEALQFELKDSWGRVLARWDMAWPSARVAIELDGREYHDGLQPLYRDRSKSNAGAVAGWLVLRFTWWDVMNRPEWVVQTVRTALASRSY